MATRLFLIAVGFAAVSVWPDVAGAQIHIQLGGGSHYARAPVRNYDHARRDTPANYNHYRPSRYQNYDHAVRDIVTLGTANPYSSAGHLYSDRRQQYNHYRADEHRSYDQYVRDRQTNFYHYRRTRSRH